AGCHKDDRYSRGRGLRSKCRGRARDCVNHGHLAANEIRQQHWKSIVLILRPAVFDSHVLALDIAGFAQATTERAQTAREHVRRFTAEVSDHRHRRLLRARRERPYGRRTAEQRYEVAPFIKKTRSHGTTAKRVGSAKRLRSAKDLPFSSSRVGRRPVSNSLNYLVGQREQLGRDFKTERLGWRECHDEIKLSGLLDGDVAGLCRAQDLIDIAAGAPEKVRIVCSIGHEASRFDHVPKTVYRRQSRT